jgi:hypothetical protein
MNELVIDVKDSTVSRHLLTGANCTGVLLQVAPLPGKHREKYHVATIYLRPAAR